MDIQGKVALITGSAKRVGRATAVELAQKGATVAIHFRSDEEQAQSTLQMVQDAGGKGGLFAAELTSPSDLSRMFREIEATWGGLDILVNNASTFFAATADQTSSEDWDTQMASNAKAPFFVAQHAARLMLSRGQGKIINIADVAGEVIWPAYFAYSVSKAALIAMNRGLAKVYAPKVQVNAVAPGPVLFPDHYTAEQKQAAIDRTLLKRAGSPQDVVNAVVFLIENDYITGELIHVDGGRHIV